MHLKRFEIRLPKNLFLFPQGRNCVSQEEITWTQGMKPGETVRLCSPMSLAVESGITEAGKALQDHGVINPALPSSRAKVEAALTLNSLHQH